MSTDDSGSSRGGIRRVLRHRGFRRLLIAQTISRWGDTFNTIAAGPYMLRGLVDLVLAAVSNFAVALTSLGFYGVGTSTGNVTYNTVLQTTTPDRYRGRVFAFYDIVWQTGRLISIGAGGILADQLGIRGVYIMGELLLLAAGTTGFVLVPRTLMTTPITHTDHIG
jgi:predicted MFS family arabinose efflux permease